MAAMEMRLKEYVDFAVTEEVKRLTGQGTQMQIDPGVQSAQNMRMDMLSAAMGQLKENMETQIKRIESATGTTLQFNINKADAIMIRLDSKLKEYETAIHSSHARIS